MLFFCSLALKTNKINFCYIGTGLYALSWGVLGLGLLLAGTEGTHYLRNFLKRHTFSVPFLSNVQKKRKSLEG